MKIAALVTLILACVGIIVGLIPCAGIINWAAVPFCAVPVIVGIVGLVTDKDPETQTNPNSVLYICSIVVPIGLGIVGCIRCILGGGVV